MSFDWSNMNISVEDTKTNKPLKYKTTTVPIPNEQIEVTPKYPEPTPNYQQGWVCPKCGRVLAPWVGSCFCNYRGPYVTYDVTC